jgi:DNA-binding NtrC family response regulator
MAERVLIVEDDEALCSALAGVATRWGDDILQAHSVEQGLELLRTDPRLVIVDVRLPDGRALDVVERAVQHRPAPTVVAMSGMASAEESFELAQAGVRAYVTKPIDVEEFTERVDLALAEAPQLDSFVAASVGHRPMRAVQGEVRQVMVDQALALSDGSRSGAARLLRISRQAVQQMLRERARRGAAPTESH